MEDILFVFGSARGGTTFLSKLLEEWFSYGMGPEGTFVSEIVKKAKKIGDLSDNDKCYELAEQIINTETFQIMANRWGENEDFSISPEEVMTRMPDRSISSAIFAAFKVIADKLHMQRVGNKNPGYWRELDSLKALFPQNAKYLFIVRDGRDVALSLKNVPWGGHSAYEAAGIWVEMLETVEQFANSLEPGALLTIQYEDLLEKPGETIEAIGKFIGEKDICGIRANYERAAGENHLKSNFGKWRENMPATDQKIYEAIAGDKLTQYGYVRTYPNALLGHWPRAFFRLKAWVRLVKLNIYHLQSRLPLDNAMSKKKIIASMIKPGK